MVRKLWQTVEYEERYHEKEELQELEVQE